MVRDKFTPMAGKFFLFVDKSTGMVRIDKTGDRCMFFDTEAEAVFILDQFQDQKDKPESWNVLIFCWLPQLIVVPNIIFYKCKLHINLGVWYNKVSI